MAGHPWLLLASLSCCLVQSIGQVDTTDNCDPGLFLCRNGRCLPPNLHCDGQDDCGDGSDEIACGRGACVEGQYTCRNGNCINKKFLCDQENDCVDNTDEGEAAECDPDDMRTADNRTCPRSQFQCRSKDQCIPVRFKCDGRIDCNDHSDEDYITCETTYQVVKILQTSAAHISRAQAFLILFQALMMTTFTLIRMI